MNRVGSGFGWIGLVSYIGTGTYTILAQLTSQRTGVPLEKVEVALGDTLEAPAIGCAFLH